MFPGFAVLSKTAARLYPDHPKRRLSRFFSFCVISLMAVGVITGTAQASFFRPGHPYFLKANNLFLGLEGEGIGLPSAFLTRFELSLDYGINENISIGAVLPYLALIGADDGGTLGDVLITAKFILYQPTDLFWRILFELPVRLPTGVIREASTRRVNGVSVTYYPFSTGGAGLAPALQGALFFGGFMTGLRFTYVSENQPGENILNFNALQDRLEFQASFDYQWKFDLSSSLSLFERPSLSLVYCLNLSPSPAVPDQLLLVLENHLRFNDEWKVKIAFALPIVALRDLFRYNVAVQLGRYF